jgi:lysophospholipase L1-like esterase
MTHRLLALGDSVTCGEGVGVHVDRGDTWVGKMARAIDADLDLLANAGARISDLRNRQLPVALTRRASLTTVFIGLNDVIRGGFDPETVRDDLLATVEGLRSSDGTLLLARLHDPTAFIRLPGRLRRCLVERVAVINSAIDAGRGPGVVVLDLARIPTLQARAGWDVDRLHPSAAGHFAIAAAACALLTDSGFGVRHPRASHSAVPVYGTLAEARWLARYGAPYLARHLGQIGIPLAGMIVNRSR